MNDVSTGLAEMTNTAPAPTPAAAPAGPSAPVQPAQAPAQPLSLSDALKQAYEEPAPAPDQPPAPAGEAPTTAEPPVQADQSAAAAEKKGPIPFEVHHKALENARVKALEEFRARPEIAEALMRDDALRRDVPGTLIQMLDEAMSVPEYAQAIRSHAARVLAQRGQASATAPKPTAKDPEPSMFVDGPNGELIYDPGQIKKWQEWNQRRTEQAVMERFSPLLQLQQAHQREQQTQQLMGAVVNGMKPVVQELQQFEGFNDYKADIVKRQQELFEQAWNAGEQPDSVALLWRAYREIVPAKLRAKQQEQLRASAVNAAAGRDVNPAVVATTTPTPPKTLQEAFRQVGLG